MREQVILIVGFNGSGKTLLLAKENIETKNPDARMQEIQADFG